jgi:hypothetical protein
MHNYSAEANMLIIIYLQRAAAASQTPTFIPGEIKTGIMPCATFRTIAFQQSRIHSFKNCLKRSFGALVFSKAHSNALPHSKCLRTK